MASRTEAGRVRTDPRISRRRKAVARSKRKRVARTVVALLITGGAVWAAFWSPLLDVRRVQVAGVHHSDPDDVRAAASLGSDDNLLLVSTGAIARAVEELPWVRDADVHRRLPGTVRIKITERDPALVLTVPSGTWTLDADGRVLAEGTAATGLPSLSGTTVGGIAPGDQLETDEVAAALKVWRSLPRSITATVESVLAPSAQRISLVLTDATIVRYGGADHTRSKNEVLHVLLARLSAQGRRATYVDVSVPTSPAVGPAPTITPTPTPLSTP